MNRRVVSVELPSDLLLAVHDLATEKEGTIGSVVEDLLIAHLETRRKRRPKTNVADQRFVFGLQKLLFRDMAEATDWADLDSRLRKHGFFMQISWGGLSLHTQTSGHKLCNTHELGFSCGTFIRRFGPGKPKNPREI